MTELVERVLRGEDVTITRGGEPVARLIAIERTPRERTPQPIDFEALRALTDSMRGQDEPAESGLRALRDAARY